MRVRRTATVILEPGLELVEYFLPEEGLFRNLLVVSSEVLLEICDVHNLCHYSVAEVVNVVNAILRSPVCRSSPLGFLPLLNDSLLFTFNYEDSFL